MVQLVTITTHETFPSAHVVRSVLEDAGLAVSLSGAEFVSMEWLFSNAVGGIKVRVPVEQAELAVQVLAERRQRDLSGEVGLSEEDLIRQALAEPREEEVVHLDYGPSTPDTEPKGVDRDHLAWRAFCVAWLSFGFPPLIYLALAWAGLASLRRGRITHVGRLRICVTVLLIVFLKVLLLWQAMFIHFSLALSDDIPASE